MPALLTRLRLLLVGLHLLSGACQVALLYPFCDVPGREQLKRRWSQRLLALLGIGIDSAGIDTAAMGAGLIVSNHISFIDIFVVNALFPSGFVAKSEVSRWPLIGWLSRHADTVFIERGSRKAAHRTHLHMTQALAAGRRLAIFPEGTTTVGESILPFHAALFQSAIDAAVPVHAFALAYHKVDGSPSDAPAYIDDLGLIECLLNVLRAGSLVARVRLAASIAPPLTDRRHLAHRSHQAIAATLKHLPGKAPAISMDASDPANKGVNLPASPSATSS